jgi:UDP-GlcNAc:undecaprenyl-phosphate GlcNAc-1-phosphate transferase
MGDSGSFFVGFILAAIALMGEWAMEEETLKAILVPVLILVVPLYDLLLTTIFRAKDKKIKNLREAITMSA